MKTATKKRPANGDSETKRSLPARKRGGARCREIESPVVATKTKAISESQFASENQAAGGKSKRRSGAAEKSHTDVNGEAAGDSAHVNVPVCASRKTKGRSVTGLKPRSLMNGQGGEGDAPGDADWAIATSRQKQPACVIPLDTASAIACRSIQELQRHRRAAIKIQVAGENQIVAHVATLLGYSAGLEEADRKKRFVESRKLIKAIVEGEALNGHAAIAANVQPLVKASNAATALIVATRDAYEKQMESLAKQLPVLPWVKSVRGFGVLNLAIVIGEAGDLSKYANPAKLWRRLGLAPFKGAMGSTHRMKGSLSKEEWSEFGYSPRRRSQLHLLAMNMVMQNDGEYRKRYDEAKAKAKEAHPDWKDGHLHAHGMLLALKRVILDLWKAWNKPQVDKFIEKNTVGAKS